MLYSSDAVVPRNRPLLPHLPRNMGWTFLPWSLTDNNTLDIALSLFCPQSHFTFHFSGLGNNTLADMASVDYIFKTVKYDTKTVHLTATVHLPKDTTSVKAIGETPTRSLYRK